MLRCVIVLQVVLDAWDRVGLSNVAEDAGDTVTPLSHPLPSPPDSEDVRLSLEACERPEHEYALEFKDVGLPLEPCEATELDNRNAVLDVFAAIAGPITGFTLGPNDI